MKRQAILFTTAIAVVIIVLGGWFAFSNPEIAAAFGMHHAAKGSANGMASSTPSMMGMRGGFVQGSIATLNGNGFTVSLQDGTTKTVSLTATSSIQYFATASSTPATTTLDHLSVGEQVSVMGAVGSDGTIAAARVLAGTFPAHMPGNAMGGMPRDGMSSSTWTGRGQGGPGRMGSSTDRIPPSGGAPMQSQ